MKIGVISDTHIPTRTEHLSKKILAVFSGVQQILHAGDIEQEAVLTELEAIAPVYAVAGNMDWGKTELPYKRQLEFNNIKIGLIHGYGVPREQVREYIRKEFIDPNIIIYGHTHIPFWGKENGIFFMNPGSPASGQQSNVKPTVGVIEIKGKTISGEIITL